MKRSLMSLLCIGPMLSMASIASGQQNSVPGKAVGSCTSPPIIAGCLSTPTYLGCNPKAPPICRSAITARDCRGAIAAKCAPGPVTGSGCHRTQGFTYSATGTGGTSVCTETYVWAVDTEPPVIRLANPAKLSCNPTPEQIKAAFGAATVTDSCVGNLTATGTVGPEEGTGRQRSVTKSWTVTDSCGQTGIASQTLTFHRDTEKPVITLTPASAVEPACNPTAEQIAAAFGTASVNDNASTNLWATWTTGPETAGSGVSCSVTRTWTVRDSCGNATSATQTARFKRDTMPPLITGPTDVIVSGQGKRRAAATLGTATATDNGGPVKITNDAPKNPNGSVATFSVGTNIVTWTATDGCGNTATCRQKVTVLGVIKAVAFFDANGNGIQDLPVAATGEGGVPNVKLSLSNGASSADGSGSALFNVAPGTYTVSATVPSGWIKTTETFDRISIDSTSSSVTALFGILFLCKPSNGLPPSFWTGAGGANILKANADWVTLLNSLTCLRNADGTLHSFTDFNDLKAWFADVTPTNMAYLLSVHLAANVLSSTYNRLDGAVFVSGGAMTKSRVCIVPFLRAPQPELGTCGAPLLPPASFGTPSACGCGPSYDGRVTIGALQLKAACLLAAYRSTVAASKERTYQECVKAILDMIDNTGDASRTDVYPCGGVRNAVPTGICPIPVPPSGTGRGQIRGLSGRSLG